MTSYLRTKWAEAPPIVRATLHAAWIGSKIGAISLATLFTITNLGAGAYYVAIGKTHPSRTAWHHNQRHLHSSAFLPRQFACHGSCKRCRRGLRISISTDPGRYARQCLWYRRLLRGNASLALDVVGWTFGEFVLRILDLSIRSWRSRRLRSRLRLCAATSAA
jgi:hypothetical protein